MLRAAPQSQLDDVLAGFEEEKSCDRDPSLDDIMEGFEDRTPTPDPAQTAAPLPYSLNGYLKMGASYNFAHKEPDAGETDWRGLSRLKTEAGLDLQVKSHDHWRMRIEGKYNYDWAYNLKGRDEFNEDVLDEYEQETELGEAYIQGRLHRHLDLKVGRQIVVWGRSDNIRVTDVLNPLDLREPGLIDMGANTLISLGLNRFG